MEQVSEPPRDDTGDGPSFKAALLAQVPALRAFARTLCGDAVRADDLTQDALLRAWAAKSSYAPETNMRAWLFTILRNAFYSELRHRRREVEDPGDAGAAALSVAPGQQHGLEIRDLRRALARLPAEQREALILVGASGCSYEEAARICGCAVGTVKSRVSRARQALNAYYEPPAEASTAAQGGRGAEPGPSAPSSDG